MRRRLRIPLAGMTLLGAATWMVISPTSAHAVSAGADAHAWWYIGNQGVVSAPPPPTVGAQDLFVEGAKGDAGSLPTSPPPPFPSGVGDRGLTHAIAALRYTVPAGALVDRVKLKFAGSAPSSVQLLACRTTAPFKAEQGGPWADVPPYDCTVPSIGSLSQASGGASDGVLFTDIAALVQGSSLSFVIVPSSYDMEDFQAPGPDSLTFRAGPPPFDPGAAPAAQPGFAAGSSSSAAATAGGVPTVPLPGGLPAPFGPGIPARADPATANAPAPARPAGQVAAPRLAGLDDRTARITAGIGLGISILAFAVLLAMESPRLRRMLGMRIASSGGPFADAGARGLGAFVQPRSGRPPGLW